MPRRFDQLQQALDRRWRGGHPFRPRLSPQRRIGMLILFCLLCAIIGAYWYLTDADRVRTMAEAYLSKVLAGRVEVGQANLSIFEGLRLDDIRVHANPQPEVDSEGSPADDILFRAKTFRLDYNPRALLAGKIEAAQIVAIAPELRLTQDRDTGEWNYQRIVRNARERKRATTRRSATTGPVVFPEILLRDGRVDNGELVDGEYHALGSLGFEGRLSPTGGDGGRFAFEIQCHGPSDPVGPSVTGWMVPDTGQFRVRLKDFAFGGDIRGMLPFEVRSWWESHALAGSIDTTDVFYSPARAGRPADWRVETGFKDITLRIRPEEWRSRRQNLAIERVRDAMAITKSLALGSPATYVEQLFKFTRSVPITLEHGHGVLAFDTHGLEIKDLSGLVEGSRLQITGKLEGYTPDAGLQLHVQSLAPEHVTLADQPRFIWSLPTDVQENWLRFHPVGSVKLALDVNRPSGTRPPHVTGVIDVIDGSFVCDRFPYPCRKPTGQILLDVDPEHGGGTLELKNLKGYGIVGGPNENKALFVRGLVDHLGPDPGMHLEIEAPDIVSEPAVLAAIPPDARSAVTLFDAPGKGEFPRFAGGFKCRLDREPGKDKHIFVNLDLDIRNGSGRLKSFPYPLENFSARAEIRDDYVDIPWAKMDRNGTTLNVSGRVRWKDYLQTGEKIGTNLKVAVQGMRIDQDLMNALTPVRRQWLQKVGLTGTLDFDGRIFSDKSESDIVVDLGLALRDGAIAPPLAAPDPAPRRSEAAGSSQSPTSPLPPLPTSPPPTLLTSITGHLHLSGEQLELQQLTGHRGDGTVTLDGLVSWQNDDPKASLKAAAVNLALDKPLYDLLPPEARTGWDAVNPVGTIDATVTYTYAPSSQQATSNGQPAPLSLTLRPRKLSITPKIAPYRLDDLTGEVTIADDKITLKDLKGHHNKGTLAVSGTGATAANSDWTLSLAGTDLTVDDEFLKGMPPSVAAVLNDVSYRGLLGFSVPKLSYRGANNDLDFEATLTPNGGSLDAGVPMADARGTITLAGSVRNDQLHSLAGNLAIDSVKVAGRDARDLRAELLKSPGEADLHIKSLQGDLAGGAVAGDVTVSMPEYGPARYSVNMVLRDADVRQVAGDESMNGTFTASVELAGVANDPKSRIGRGDVLASGKEMYKVPVLMGLLQITNLSLPFTSPFNQAQAQYILQGNQMTFENIELRSASIVMRGAGSINFDTKKLRLTFNTDSPTHWIKVPIVQDFWQQAKKELFQITIRGTVQEPKVSASAFHTITTTVDEVLSGGGSRSDR